MLCGNVIGVANASLGVIQCQKLYSDMYDRFSKELISSIIHLSYCADLQNGVGMLFSNVIGVADDVIPSRLNEQPNKQTLG